MTRWEEVQRAIHTRKRDVYYGVNILMWISRNFLPSKSTNLVQFRSFRKCSRIDSVAPRNDHLE